MFSQSITPETLLRKYVKSPHRVVRICRPNVAFYMTSLLFHYESYFTLPSYIQHYSTVATTGEVPFASFRGLKFRLSWSECYFEWFLPTRESPWRKYTGDSDHQIGNKFEPSELFQKRINSIFFGTKAAKRKLSILKERWFDIATSDFKNNSQCVTTYDSHYILWGNIL
jgi:hypothetical protein